MIIDTHSHLNFESYQDDREKVIEKTLSANVWMINIGTNYETSKKAVEIAGRYSEGVYATVGLHPIHSIPGAKTDKEEGGFTARGEEFDKEKYKMLASSEKVVAIGEVGLDYYYSPYFQESLQKKILSSQLDLAEELNLPVVFHCRKAHKDLIETLRGRSLKGVVHCFTGNWNQAKEYLDMGFYLGFNGIIFKLNLDKTIKKAPLDRILIETDCPFLTPPVAAKERNEPIFVTYIIDKINNVRGERVERATTQNAKTLFRL